MNGVLLFNPKATFSRAPVPNSILSIAASINHLTEWAIVDGNCEPDPYRKLEQYLQSGKFKYIGFTVMPGPQLRQAIPFAKAIKHGFPDTKMIWGGYFPAAQYQAVLDSGFVDFIINGPG